MKKLVPDNADEVVYRLDDGSHLHAQTSDDGYDWTWLSTDAVTDLDGGRFGTPDMSFEDAVHGILSLLDPQVKIIESVSLEEFEAMREGGTS